MNAAFLVVPTVVFLHLLQVAWTIAVVGAFISLVLTCSPYVHTYSELKSFVGEEYLAWSLIGSLILGALILKVFAMVFTKVPSIAVSH
jgi:hypothetical protein